MKQYAKEGKKAKFATDREMEIVREEEKRKELGEEYFNEGQYNVYMQTKSKDPKFYVPELDAETLRQVRELERKEATIGKKLKTMKLAEGVSMVEYDELGRAKSKPAEEPKIVIVPDTAEEQPGILIDEDKKYEELSEDEKEVRDCLNNEEGDGDLEDNFILLANGGLPALIDTQIDTQLEIKEEESEESEHIEDCNSEEADSEQLNAMVDEYIKSKKTKGPIAAKPLHPPENLLPDELKCEHEEVVISPEENEKIKGTSIC